MKDQGIELAIARAHLPLREVTMNVEMARIFSKDEIFTRVSDAVNAYNERTHS